MKDLFTLGIFEGDTFVKYVRKGRSNAIVAYDNLAGARRGKSQCYAHGSEYRGKDVRIIRALDVDLQIIE